MPKHNIPSNFVTDSDILSAYSEDVSGETLVPDYLVRPESTEQVSDVLEYCNKKRIAVTPAGSQTNDTASSLALNGLCLSTERLKRIIKIDASQGIAIVEPGILLGDLKQALREHDLFYPPDPSSENMATLGGTVATNAAGARSYKYGQTSNHILGLEVVLPNGSIVCVSNTMTSKSSTGPSIFSKASELWVGSEGIFGIFTKIKIKLFRGIPKAFAILAFFPEMNDMLTFAMDLKANNYPLVSPRSIEFMDGPCLELLKNSNKYSLIPSNAHGAIILEQEYKNDFDILLEGWLQTLEKAKALTSDSIVADTEPKINALRELRHHIPSTLNELGTKARASGGRKVSTDWAVPLAQLPSMMHEAEKLGEQFGFGPERTYRFAHLGDGHPHYNFIPETNEELNACLNLRQALSKLAVSHGGTVAGEHGIGKLRKDLLEFEKTPLKLELLRAIKKEIDPNGIMSPGNLL